MDYQLALPPNLGISPAEFVAAWNETPACRTVAPAHLSEQTGATYDPTLDMIIALSGTVALGIATNALYDLIKEALHKAQAHKGAQKHTHKRTQITKLDQPDGTHLLIVTIEEE